MIAVPSSPLGGGAAVATRLLVGGFDPVTLAAVRSGGGALCLPPLALLLRQEWPARARWRTAGHGWRRAGVWVATTWHCRPLWAFILPLREIPEMISSSAANVAEYKNS